MDNTQVIQRSKLFLQVAQKFPDFCYLGDPILRRKTKLVSIKEGLEIGEKLGLVLIAYRQIANIGRGLAAPQIGISKSVFVTYLNDEVQIFINPKIISKSNKRNRYRELCLSCGFLWGDVVRPDRIVMEWKDKEGKVNRKEFTDFEARLVQHEYDHLLGIPNLDKAENKTIEFVTTNPLREKLRPA